MEQRRLFVYFLLLTVAISEVHTQITETPIGTLKGTIVYYDNEPVEAYLGIPYARPPIGPLRFMKPVPMDPFLEPREAAKFGAGCLQHSKYPFPWLDDMPGLSEDCLFLNIWTPFEAKDSEQKAVIFFIHGGGFHIGSSRLDYFDGKTLAKEGDVIVVTINYRLGPLGFLDLGINEAAGNMGLYDILEALKWVNKNIESFGGNKNQITLFGWSAGAITAGVFCISPLAKGLFQRVVMSSGSPANMRGEDNNQDYELSRTVAEKVGCLPSGPFEAESVLECLRGVNGMELTMASSNSKGSFYFKYGDQIVPSNARQALINGDFREVEVLIGANEGDGSFEITKLKTEVFGFFGEKKPQVNKTFAESIIRQLFKGFANPDAVVEHYLEYVPDDHYDDIRFQVSAAIGDYKRICPPVYFAESLAGKSDNPVYFYFFTHITQNSPWAKWMRAMHFDDIPYYFGYALRNTDMYNPAEQSLSRDMMRFLTNFVKYGYPAQNWTTYSKERHIFKYLNTLLKGFSIGPDFSNCEFFRPYFGF